MSCTLSLGVDFDTNTSIIKQGGGANCGLGENHSQWGKCTKTMISHKTLIVVDFDMCAGIINHLKQNMTLTFQVRYLSGSKNALKSQSLANYWVVGSCF